MSGARARGAHAPQAPSEHQQQAAAFLEDQQDLALRSQEPEVCAPDANAFDHPPAGGAGLIKDFSPARGLFSTPLEASRTAWGS